MKQHNPFINAILSGTLLLVLQSSVWSAPEYMVTNVFTSGVGYHTYRIPAMVRANDGTLLAFCEARASISDLGDIDIVLKRSTDNGATWGPLIVAQSDGTFSIGNPAPVVDRTTGHIHMLFCKENEFVFHTVSTDNGLTWSARTEITSSVKLPEWGWYATGPCHGVQLTRGEQAGRLVVPANHAIGPGASDTVEKGAQFIYSDDNGATWQMDAYFERQDSDLGVAPNESTLVELNTPGDGGTNSHIYMNSRDYGTDPGNRSETWSGDGGGSFSIMYDGNPHFLTPICQGSLIRFSAIDEGDAQNRIIFSSPNHGSSRQNGSLWTTTNEAASWSPPKQLFSDGYAYSDMAVTDSGDLGVLAECNTGGINYSEINFIRVNEEWLDDIETDAPTPNPATFSQAPVAINYATITMIATAGIDETAPIEYLFTETSGNPGGTSSGWTTNPTYTDSDLSPETEYTYTVTMRDPHGNTGTSSVPVSATTPDGTGLFGLNLSWEDDGVSGRPFTAWVETSLGSDPLDSGDFRVAQDPDNWFPDSTAGEHVLLLEGDDGNEYGRLTQQLTGTAATGTYTFVLHDVGVANFGDNNNAEFKFGFSLDGTNLIAGSEMTLTEGSAIFSPVNGSVTNYSVTYSADGTETLHLIIETTGNHTGRSVPTIGSASVIFLPVTGDVEAPTPNPATFSVAPTAIGPTEITMTSTTGVDASGPVEYLFTETSGNPGATSSGWIISNVYTDTGLNPDTEYTYTVQMRDALGNMGTASAPVAGSTPEPPVPGSVLEVNFEHLSGDSTVANGTRIQDVSGNGYHGFFSGNNIDVVPASNGTAIDNGTAGGTKGIVILQDNLTGIPAGWDGPTTTVSPYFQLDGSATGSWTIEAVVSWDNTDSASGLFGQTGGNQIWMRENGGYLQYAIGASDAVNHFSTGISVTAEKVDGKFHTIALVYDGPAGEVRTYVDGTLKHTNTDDDIGNLPSTMLSGTGDFHLGAYRNDSAWFHAGEMAHFRISDYALAPSEFISTAPAPAQLSIGIGPGGVTVGTTNLSAAAGVTNTVQFTDDLVDGVWSNLSVVTGTTMTNWVYPTTGPHGFYRIESTY